jgi:glycosyltransferase involved in cell wall biosynthesis
MSDAHQKSAAGSGPNEGAPVTYSFVIPARNEEFVLARTLHSIHEAAQECSEPYEIIVVDDGSTDATPRIAREQGADVLSVTIHNIGAVRNAGAARARGEILFFLDADTQLPAETLRAARRALDAGAVGGGASVEFDDITLFQRLLAAVFIFIWQRLCGWAAGCSIFVWKREFEAVGGFDPQYFAAEERYLSGALKQRGKFVILRETVLTSGRKLRLFSTWHLLRIGLGALLKGKGQLTRPEGLEVLYDAPRETGSEADSDRG